MVDKTGHRKVGGGISVIVADKLCRTRRHPTSKHEDGVVETAFSFAAFQNSKNSFVQQTNFAAQVYGTCSKYIDPQ